ncbi:hypothetical protein [Lentilactobacillus senioris]|uniref:hypothetical protein n=1 Tax=Lentilactobacillus senioris TaxID=931534 RepID=UPI0006D1727F|nr:hypothetical protein [Lentilactobacillus senioris]
MTPPVTDATKVQAIAMHNVDITDGPPKAATVIKRGGTLLMTTWLKMSKRSSLTKFKKLLPTLF